MTNEIIEKINQLPSKSEARNITVKDKGKYIETVNSLVLEQKISISTTINGSLITSNLNTNNEFYNLFILENEDFSKTYFYIKKNDLLKNLDDSVKIDHSLNNIESLINNCINYPCIFANKNKNYKKASIDQIAYFGYLCKIEKCDTGLKFYFSFTCNLKQQIFNDNSKQLGIKASKGNNELDIIHWSIKKINLINELFKLGYRVASY